MKNFSETDQASMPLGIFASKSVSCRHSNADLHKKSAFTLAEVLITLGIIGVVAAITLPVLLSNVDQKVKAERVTNIKQKLSKVTDKMAVQSGLMGYDSTDAFVKEMQRHMKIAKVCDNAHLANCWPSKEVTLDDAGKSWEISKTKTAKTLKVAKADGDDWSDTVGIVTGDGTAMILSYNKGCTFDIDKEGLKSGDSKGSISNSLNCLAGVFDWNGGKKPNKLAKLEGNSNGDVLLLGKASGLGSECSIKLGDKCFTAPFTPSPLTKAECEAEKGKLGIKGCNYDTDYWAGAVKQCGGVSKMPTADDLAKLATELYGTSVGAEQDIWNGGLTLDTSKASSLGFTGTSFYVWSGKDLNSGFAYYRAFSSLGTLWGYNYRTYSNFQAVCAGE